MCTICKFLSECPALKVLLLILFLVLGFHLVGGGEELIKIFEDH